MQQQPITQQQIFDKVVVHLHEQNEQSMNAESGGCAYRGDNGLMCAVGCLITDEAFNPKFNILSVRNDEVFKMLIASGVSVSYADEDDTVLLLESLQEIHDDPIYAQFGFGMALVGRLKETASKFNLSTETLDKLPLNPKQ